jgi:hypothetical protein
VFVFIAVAMLIVMAVIGFMGPRTRDLALEKISYGLPQVIRLPPLASGSQR